MYRGNPEKLSHSSPVPGGPPTISFSRLLSSSTSQAEKTSLPLRNLASGEAIQTRKSAGRETREEISMFGFKPVVVILTVVVIKGQLGSLGQLGRHGSVEESRVHVVKAHLRVLGSKGLEELDGRHLAAHVGTHTGERREENARSCEIDECKLLLLVGQDGSLCHHQRSHNGRLVAIEESGGISFNKGNNRGQDASSMNHNVDAAEFGCHLVEDVADGWCVAKVDLVSLHDDIGVLGPHEGLSFGQGIRTASKKNKSSRSRDGVGGGGGTANAARGTGDEDDLAIS